MPCQSSVTHAEFSLFFVVREALHESMSQDINAQSASELAFALRRLTLATLAA